MLAVKTLRILAVCLLVLALPLQGFAAASKLLCHGAVQQHEDHAHSAHANGTHDEHNGHDRSHASEQTSQTKHTTHQCSHCAQCCAGMAIASVQKVLFEPVKFSAVWVTAPEVFATHMTPSSIERPPRSPLA